MIAALITLMALQEGALDILDGETLYEDGWLFTAGVEVQRSSRLLRGSSSVSDPLGRVRTDVETTVSAHYGLRHDLQLSVILPYVSRHLKLDDPAGPDRLGADGVGDMTFVGKFRFKRWDGDGWALNLAAIGGLELPTGESDARDGGVRLPPELQPGSGSWNPFVGAAITHEPGRWRFNACVLYQRNGQNSDNIKRGDEFFMELAGGNRFWLEPYPGPFMRGDVMLRYRHRASDSIDGASDPDSGSSLVTLGATWAFRIRPTIEIEVAVEVPIFESVDGTQLSDGFSVFFVFGYRI